MAISTRAMTGSPLERLPDDVLLARFRGGDPDALDVAFRRHEGKLRRYAARILGDRSPNADDVVQEALLRTHVVLRRDDRPLQLEPWLYTLVRNCALDELARVRADVGSLEGAAEPAARGADPADVTQARSAVRDTLADVASLPQLQRYVLLRREVEGASHAEVADELGISEPASRVLVRRARVNLVKAREGRDARCDDVREELLAADDAGRRANAHALRHLAACGACRDFRAALRRRRADLRVLVPLPAAVVGLVGLKALIGGTAAPSGTGAKVVAAGAATAAVAGGALGLQQVAGPGDPSPVAVHGAVVPGGLVARGAPLPPRTAVVTRTVRAERPVSRHVLACPTGLRVAGLAPASARASQALAPSTVVGASTRATVLAERPAGASRLTLAVVCRRPDAAGSILAAPELAATAASSTGRASVCARRVYLRRAPVGGAVVGSLSRRQPVVVRRSRDGWRAVTADTGARGWVPAGALCSP